MRFAMTTPLRDDFDAPRLRSLARSSKDAGQARRLLALAAIYEGAKRHEAAKIGGVTLQIVRDWVVKFNARGAAGLIAHGSSSAGANGLVVTSMAPTSSVEPKVAAYVERWKKEMGREPVGLPYTQYFYDAPWLVAQLAGYVRSHKMPETGESYRAALLAQRTFEQPLTGTVTFNPDHTVDKPIYIWSVKDLTFQCVGLAPKS